jgi:hypothetical protein
MAFWPRYVREREKSPPIQNSLVNVTRMQESADPVRRMLGCSDDVTTTMQTHSGKWVEIKYRCFPGGKHYDGVIYYPGVLTILNTKK